MTPTEVGLHAHPRDLPDPSDCTLAATRRVQSFLDTHRPETPCLVVDLAVVAHRYHEPDAALPGVDLYDAVKANPAQPVLRLLAELGCWFGVANPAEIDACLAGSVETVRRRTDGGGADWPLSKRFGCGPDDAAELVTRVAAHGGTAGPSFHVGSQQRDLGAWDTALTVVEEVATVLDARGVPLGLVNLGGVPRHVPGGDPTGRGVRGRNPVGRASAAGRPAAPSGGRARAFARGRAPGRTGPAMGRPGHRALRWSGGVAR